MGLPGLLQNRYSISIIGSVAALVGGYILSKISHVIVDHASGDEAVHYRRRKAANTLLGIAVVVAIFCLWVHHLQHAGTFAGLVGAGLAVALKEPLLAIAGRIAVFAGHMYNVGDRVEIQQMKGDVIDVGFFYTRLMEIGNWVGGDQASGRIVQFSNSLIFGTPVFNYTQNFGYIWDEIELPVTYSSDTKAASKILLEVGTEYTEKFLKGAQAALQKMQRYFLVPRFELKPVVYIEVTSNWVSLKMRYVVDPKERRNAKNFLWREIFGRMQKRQDITIGSSTMDLTVRPAEQKQAEQPGEDS
ncbi:MAG TPA: mechanosensitive ion channel family protein, partial [Terriglobales bacterium]|nr:mechanosensitive ion channel family protein [Terriglobales bacterium]